MQLEFKLIKPWEAFPHRWNLPSSLLLKPVLMLLLLMMMMMAETKNGEDGGNLSILSYYVAVN
jgi:hypothetical protein